MAYGIKTYDANGNVTSDLTFRHARHIITHTTSVPSGSITPNYYATVSMPEISDNGKWFVIHNNCKMYIKIFSGYYRIYNSFWGNTTPIIVTTYVFKIA